ncbi:MAG: hypothetical protein JW762_04890 [Dehalococcoidales bacterium]|nr:hypothetical protein [Dehalococcoidales bacterium]
MKQIWVIVWKSVKWIGRVISHLLPKEGTWKEIHVSPNKHPEPTLRRFSYLRNHGIRCKLHNLTSPSGRGVVAGMISLRVHRNDVGKAYVLLRDIKD